MTTKQSTLFDTNIHLKKLLRSHKKSQQTDRLSRTERLCRVTRHASEAFSHLTVGVFLGECCLGHRVLAVRRVGPRAPDAAGAPAGRACQPTHLTSTPDSTSHPAPAGQDLILSACLFYGLLLS